MKELIDRLVYGRVRVLFTYIRRQHAKDVLEQLKRLPGAKYVAGDIVFRNGSRAVFRESLSVKSATSVFDERYHVQHGEIRWE